MNRVVILVAVLVLAAVGGSACNRGGVLGEAEIAAAAQGSDTPEVSGTPGGYQRQCNAGEASGCLALGMAFQSGTSDVAKNQARATRLFWKACENGNGEGCNALGNAFREGYGGTRRDDAVAKKWYRKGCDLQNPTACQALKSLE